MAPLGFSAMIRVLDMKRVESKLSFAQIANRLEQDPGETSNQKAYPSFTKYLPGNCLTSRFNSRRKRTEETVGFGRLHLAAIASMAVSLASIASYTLRSDSDNSGNGRVATAIGFDSGKRIWRSSRISEASITSFAPC